MHSPTTGPNKNDQTGAGDDIRNQLPTPPNERGQIAAASKNLSIQHNEEDESAASESGVDGGLGPQNPSASKLETTNKEEYEDGTWDRNSVEGTTLPDAGIPLSKGDGAEDIGGANKEYTTARYESGVALEVENCATKDVMRDEVPKSLGSVPMCSVRKIIASGVTTIEFSAEQPRQERFVYEHNAVPGQIAGDDYDLSGTDAYGSDADTDDESTASQRNLAKPLPRRRRQTDFSPAWRRAKNNAKDVARAVSAERPRYKLDPLYVLELRDDDGEVVHRTESTKPVNRKPSDSSSVLEVVRIIKSRARVNPYAAEQEKKRMFENGYASSPELHILSPFLVNALHEVATYFPERINDGKMRLPYPYTLLSHHRKELEEFKAQNPMDLSDDDVEERNKHIDCALNFVNMEHNENLRAEDARHARDPPATTFKNYWMLLKPGTIVYRSQYGISSCYIVQSVTGGVEDERLEQYTISLWNLSYNGRSFGRCSEVAFLKPFDGERVITTLPLYPMRLHEDREGELPLKERLIARGRKFMSLTKPSYCNYQGQTLTSPKRTYNGRVMIDTALLPWEESKHPGFTPRLEDDRGSDSDDSDTPYRRRRRYRRYSTEEEEPKRNRIPALAKYDTLNLDSELTPDQLLLCSYYVFGYVFSVRQWAILDVEKIVDRNYDPDLMDKLVISPENKHLIKAICRDYTPQKISDGQKDWSADFIQGKGEGQIFLLHGRPGVGKTLTAECVAEYTQRPLLSITPGDIGTEPAVVEQALAKFFRLGELWGAILLLDEADVYLESRNERDLTRNSLVSVFLRALEYYQGILFLTTNRVGSFDEAFASRIHVSIHYGDLGAEGRQTIWENLFDDLESDRPEVRIEYSARSYVREDASLQTLEWNGRQIRNAFRTAVSLAEYEAAEAKSNPNSCKHCKQPGHTPDICWIKHPETKGKKIFIKHQHLKSATEMSSRFKDYLESTKDAKDSKLAKLSHMRDDNFVDGQARRGLVERGPKK